MIDIYIIEYKIILTKLFYILLLGLYALRDSNPRRSLRRQLLYPVKLRAHNFLIINKKAIAEAMTFYSFKYKLLDYCSLALSTLNKINMRTIQIGIIITDSLKP